MMLSEDQKKCGVIAASAGNHALALAYHGGKLSKYYKFCNDSRKNNIVIVEKLFSYIPKLDIPVTVVMPVVAPIMKVENCKKFGANVLIHGANIGESRDR